MKLLVDQIRCIRPKCFAVLLICFFNVSVHNPTSADWPQWGGSSTRNATYVGKELPESWSVGQEDQRAGELDTADAKNLRWVARIGSYSYRAPVISGGRVFVSTNNGAEYLPRYKTTDLGCLLCFSELDGAFLWQFSAEKLATGRVHDWPMSGIASSPLIEGDRAWFVSNRGEIVCVDTEGFYDGVDDGPVVDEEMKVLTITASVAVQGICEALDRGELATEIKDGLTMLEEEVPHASTVKVEQAGSCWSCKLGSQQAETVLTIQRDESTLTVKRPMTKKDIHEADVVWRFDMMSELGSRQYNLASCCLASWGDILFACTGNGVDETHVKVPAPDAASFIAIDKKTGRVLWTSNLPSRNVHSGQWSSPAVGLIGGVPQVIFGGGDGWVYSFHAEKWRNQEPILLWKFDTNEKTAPLQFVGSETRSEPIAPPVIYDDQVFVTIGQNPERGEGSGAVFCIDATKFLDGRDVSPTLVVGSDGNPKPVRRGQQVFPWTEKQLNATNLESELDQKILTRNSRTTVFGKKEPDDLSIEIVIPGAAWRLITSTQEGSETLYIWKRFSVINGQIEEGYYLASPTGESVVENPDSALVWKFSSFDQNGDGSIDFEEQMHRSLSSVVVHQDLVFCTDFSGLVHCLDRKSGRPHWSCDMLAPCWGTPLIANNRMIVCDEFGGVAIFSLSSDAEIAGAIHRLPNGEPAVNYPTRKIEMPQAIHCSPVAANGILYISTRNWLFAIGNPTVD